MKLYSLVLLSCLSLLAETSKPNFLFIFADDQSYETVRALGYDEIHTPNLDKLVESGTTFTHAYNMGGWHGAVCMASRTMLNTGRFIWSAGRSHPETERQQGRLWSDILNKAGYQTFMAGKWHVEVDATKTFRQTGSVRGGMPKDHPAGYNRPLASGDMDWYPNTSTVIGYEQRAEKVENWTPWDKKFGGFWQGGKHWSEVLADESIAFLESEKNNDDPFFMYVAFNAPHDPRQAPKKYVDMYPLDKISVPANFRQEYPYGPSIGNGVTLRDEALAPFPRTHHSVKVNRQEYYAIITHMDHQIGRILDSLKASGKAENTYVIFTADHGLAVGHHGFIGKQNMYDHSVRVPFMIAGPGIKAEKNSRPIYLQDAMPTTLDLAGVKKPVHVDFKSLVPQLKDQGQAHYNEIYSCYMDYQRMVVKGDYKLIYYNKLKVSRLFNLKNDPMEMNDLANDQLYAEKLIEMKNALLKLQKEVKDPLPIKF